MLQYKRFFDLSTDLLSIVSLDGHFRQVNPAFRRTLGYAETELLAAPLLQFVHPSDQETTRRKLEALAAGKSLVNHEIRCRCKDTTYRWLQWSAQPALDEGVIYAVAHDVDAQKAADAAFDAMNAQIEERKAIEAELRASLERAQELNSLKTRFLSMVSHEFLTPLTIMMTSCEMMRNYSDRMPPERRLAYIEKIEAHIQYLSGLVSNILTINRSETVGLDFKPAPIDLRDFLQAMIDEMQIVTETHLLEFELRAECPTTTHADERLLRQVFINLISNAVKYSPNADRVTIALACDESALDIRVRDYGIGIPDDERQHLFSNFFRASNVGSIPGTGLGLAVIQRAVSAHGGTVELESEVGRGTTFIVRLPASGAVRV